MFNAPADVKGEPLRVLYISLEEGELPICWKRPTVMLIPKEKEGRKYRLIRLTSALCTMLAWILLDSLVDKLDDFYKSINDLIKKKGTRNAFAYFFANNAEKFSIFNDYKVKFSNASNRKSLEVS